MKEAKSLNSIDELNMPKNIRTYYKKRVESFGELVAYGRELAMHRFLKPFPAALVVALDEAGFIRHDLDNRTLRVIQLYCAVDEKGFYSFFFDPEVYETIKPVTDEQIGAILQVLDDVLGPAGRRAIVNCYGLEGTMMSYDRIADQLGLQREEVIHMLRHAIRKLRSATKCYYAGCYHPLPSLYGFFEPVQVEPGTIETLRLSVRCYNCLKRAGINTIADIINLSKDQWSQVRNLSRRDLEEIERAVRAVEGHEAFSILS